MRYFGKMGAYEQAKRSAANEKGEKIFGARLIDPNKGDVEREE